MSQIESSATRRLREQVEHALATSQSQKVVEPMLERLVHLAPPGSESAVLGHRYLAEYRLQQHPWRALLHLKHVLAVHADDDVAHAMCGLAHAMSGNYRAAVAAYRAATQSAPENPWYHHNLGHLLDVALDRASAALPHLRSANEMLGDDEPEVAASLVHCLARLGPTHVTEALTLLAHARRKHPRHASLGELAKKLGAPDVPASRRATPVLPPPIPLRPATAPVSGKPVPGKPVAAKPSVTTPAPVAEAEDDPVLEALRARLGTQPARFDRARKIWRRYREVHASRRGRPPSAAILAAAVHRIVMRDRARTVTLASIARDYGVDPKAVSARSQEIERDIDER